MCLGFRTYQPSSRVRGFGCPYELGPPYQREATSYQTNSKASPEEVIMKAILSAMLALSVLAGHRSAAAFDEAAAFDDNRNGDRDVLLGSPL